MSLSFVKISSAVLKNLIWNSTKSPVLDTNVYFLMEEKLDDTDTQMKTSSRKSLHYLAVQSGRPKSSALRTTFKL
jgi:hypothetical protein